MYHGHGRLSASTIGVGKVEGNNSVGLWCQNDILTMMRRDVASTSTRHYFYVVQAGKGLNQMSRVEARWPSRHTSPNNIDSVALTFVTLNQHFINEIKFSIVCQWVSF